MKKLAFCFLLVLLSSLASAQQGPMTIRGQVTTRDDGSALPGALVSLSEVNLSVATDDSGRYVLTVPADSVRGQTVDLTVTFEGLQPRVTQIRLAPGTISRDFALAVAFGQEITVGSRVIGAAQEKSVPVDIITEEQLDTTGRSETMQAIQAIVPSFNFPRPTITDGTDTVRPATLRGLGPDQMLVLINGKRRHNSALLHANNSVGRGSTGVDMNSIPASALENVEILREGAAAQYGSDAIAGVLNLVLKSGAQAPTIELKGATTTHSDGERFDLNATYGFAVGRGSLFVVGEYKDRGPTNRARPDPRAQLQPGDAGNNPVPQPNHHWGDSEQTDLLGFLNFSYPLTEDNRTYLYAFGGLGVREGTHGGFYRRGLDPRNWPAIYPLGFLPLIEPEVDDQSLTAGARGDLQGWFWDVSSQLGHSKFDFHVSNSLNTSLGPSVPPNQTEFFAGGVEFGQSVTNVDFSRGFNVGLAGPLNIAVGLEYRDENYQIHAGEPASYIDGGHLDQFGNRAPAGSQVFPGFKPDNEVDVSRNNIGAYVDLEGDVSQMLRMGLALRFEDYSDFGSTSDYKLTLRLAPIPQLVVRGSAQTGFRAPSLIQSYNSATSTNFLLNPASGQLEPVEVGTFPVSSPVARALGATPLQPEDSSHYSFGVVWEPMANLELTVDAYHIEIEDRIVFSENFSGPLVRDVLAPFNVSGARFFTNAIDTETDGYDVVVNHQSGLWGGRLDLSGAYSHNKTDIVGTLQTPPQLVGLEEALFGHQERRRYTCAQPQDNIRLLQQFRRGSFTGSLREGRYGDFCSLNTATRDDQVYDAKWLADLELGYKWSRYNFAIGAENIFDVFPDENLPTSAQGNSGIFRYPSHSPFGMNGTILYTRISYAF